MSAVTDHHIIRTGGTLPVAPYLRPKPRQHPSRYFRYTRRGPPVRGYGDWIVQHVDDYDPIEWPVEGEA
jgi:hypothetical protein